MCVLKMGKHKKRMYMIGIIFFTLIMCCILTEWIARKRIERNMQISDSSVIEINHVPSHEDCFW